VAFFAIPKFFAARLIVALLKNFVARLTVKFEWLCSQFPARVRKAHQLALENQTSSDSRHQTHYHAKQSLCRFSRAMKLFFAHCRFVNPLATVRYKTADLALLFDAQVLSTFTLDIIKQLALVLSCVVIQQASSKVPIRVNLTVEPPSSGPVTAPRDCSCF
jgi:hypothetical protein